MPPVQHIDFVVHRCLPRQLIAQGPAVLCCQLCSVDCLAFAVNRLSLKHFMLMITVTLATEFGQEWRTSSEQCALAPLAPIPAPIYRSLISGTARCIEESDPSSHLPCQRWLGVLKDPWPSTLISRSGQLESMPPKDAITSLLPMKSTLPASAHGSLSCPR